jgi:hypothetical protein
MRQLHISNTPIDSPARREIIARLQKLDNDPEELDILLKEISEGNSRRLDKFISLSEGAVLEVMLGMPDSSINLQYRLNHVKCTLMEVALNSMNQPTKQLFERFWLFQIRQSLLAIEV